jgi:hypothetical protein
MGDSERYYVIDVDRLPMFEQFARLFAIIAYPEFEQRSKRDAFCDALTVWAIEASIKKRGLDDHHQIRPRILLQDQRKRLKALQQGIEILKVSRMLGLHVGEERYDNFEHAILANEVDGIAGGFVTLERGSGRGTRHHINSKP